MLTIQEPYERTHDSIEPTCNGLKNSSHIAPDKILNSFGQRHSKWKHRNVVSIVSSICLPVQIMIYSYWHNL